MPPRGRGKRKQTLSGRLSQEGFTFPFPVDDILDRAIRSGTDDTFSLAYSMIISSKRFRKHYSGIFRPNGTLKMTPAQYEAYVDSSRAAASSAGLTISRKQVGRAIALNQSAEEFDFRINAAKTIKSNQDHLNAFNRELKARGEKPLTSADQIFDFLTNRSTSKVYNIYESASIAGAAASAGIGIDVARAREIARRTEGLTSFQEAEEAFGAAAEQSRFADAELRSFGLSRKDVEDIALGIAPEAKRSLLQRAVQQRDEEIKTKLVQRGVGLTQQGRPVTGSRSPEPGF